MTTRVLAIVALVCIFICGVAFGFTWTRPAICPPVSHAIHPADNTITYRSADGSSITLRLNGEKWTATIDEGRKP